MKWVPGERAALADAFRAADPSDATLCEGWTASFLLAHLVLRENSAVAMLADRIAARPPGREKHLSRLAATARTRAGYDTLIGRFAAGPPRWSPLNWAGEQLNLFEFVVHHEDLRRGAGAAPPPRKLAREEQSALLERLGLIAKLAYRHVPVRVVLVAPDGRSLTTGRGAEEVRLIGGPVELALYVSGRRQAADVELTGSADATSAFLAATGGRGDA